MCGPVSPWAETLVIIPKILFSESLFLILFIVVCFFQVYTIHMFTFSVYLSVKGFSLVTDDAMEGAEKRLSISKKHIKSTIIQSWKKLLDHPCFLQFLIMQSSTNSCVYHVTKTDRKENMGCLKAVFGSTMPQLLM